MQSLAHRARGAESGPNRRGLPCSTVDAATVVGTGLDGLGSSQAAPTWAMVPPGEFAAAQSAVVAGNGEYGDTAGGVVAERR